MGNFRVENKVLVECFNVEDIVVIPDGVEAIGDSVFANTGVVKVVIPESVKIIYDKAFQNCKKLHEVEVLGHLDIIHYNSFYGCTELRSFSGSVAELSRGVFEGCTALGEVHITGLKYCREWVFKGCRRLSKITGLDKVVDIGEGAFIGCNNFAIDGALIAKFGAGIYDKQRIVSVKVPEGVTYIVDEAFMGCSNLEEVYIGEDIEEIGKRAFAGCTALTGVWLPYIVDIEEELFCGCTKLETVSMGVGTRYIKKRAFAGCTSLKSIVLPQNLQSIGSGAFANSGLTKIEIPVCIEVIEDSVFYGCESLKYVNLDNDMYVGRSNNVQIIKKDAFYGCKRLENIDIPDSVHIIESHAFCCSGLINVTIGKGIRMISSDAFYRTPIQDNQNSDFITIDGVLMC